jgi:photosystem II stability/assembly factor-like uncharacterized protein
MKSMIKFYALLLIASLHMSEVGAQKQQISAFKNDRSIDLYFAIWYIEANTWIVVGEEFDVDLINGNSLILRTEDGGATWVPQSHPTISDGSFSYLYDVCFSDPLNGWTVGQKGTILNTKDGGITWTKKYDGSTTPVFPVFCIDSLTLWAGVFGPNFYHTTDGGKTWATQINDLKVLPWDIFFFNADTGIAVGGWCDGCPWSTEHGDHSFIMRTTNGGDTWNLQENDTNEIGYQAVFFANDTIGYVAGSGGVIKRTTDGCKTWIKQESGTTTELHGIYFLNVDTGFVVGGSGGINGIMLYTTDGGTTWIEHNIPTDKALYDIYFADKNTGFAVGDWGAIISTTSGGESWTLHEWPVNINSLELLTEQNYPNPFSHYTTIRYMVPEAGNVTMKIYSLEGKIIATLVDKELVPGTYEVTWDAGDLPAGIYFCRIEAGSSAESRKLVLQR